MVGAPTRPSWSTVCATSRTGWSSTTSSCSTRASCGARWSAGCPSASCVRRGWAGTFSTTADPHAALEGADFVVVQLRIGGQAARHVDETLPVGYGCLGQETVGAGGLAKALRTVPVVLELAEEMAARANPGAWLVDFTNPVGIVTQALLDEGHRAVGLCNVAIWAQRRIGHYLGVDPDDVAVEHVGLNHLTWIRSARVGGDLGRGPAGRALRPLRSRARARERRADRRAPPAARAAVVLRALLLPARRRGGPAVGTGVPLTSRRRRRAGDQAAGGVPRPCAGVEAGGTVLPRRRLLLARRGAAHGFAPRRDRRRAGGRHAQRRRGARPARRRGGGDHGRRRRRRVPIRCPSGSSRPRCSASSSTPRPTSAWP